MGLIIRGMRKQVEKPARTIDKMIGRTKCPNPFCRSANVERVGRKWHCKACGRDFK